MPIHNVFYNRKAQPGATHFAAAVIISPIESLRQTGEMQRVDARSEIAELNLRRRAAQRHVTFNE